MKMSWSSPYILGGVWRLVRLIAPAGLEAKVEVMCSAVKLVRALLLKEPVVFAPFRLCSWIIIIIKIRDNNNTEVNEDIWFDTWFN